MGVFDVRQQTQETDEQKQQRIDNLVNSTQDKVLLNTPDLYKKMGLFPLRRTRWYWLY